MTTLYPELMQKIAEEWFGNSSDPWSFKRNSYKNMSLLGRGYSKGKDGRLSFKTKGGIITLPPKMSESLMTASETVGGKKVPKYFKHLRSLKRNFGPGGGFGKRKRVALPFLDKAKNTEDVERVVADAGEKKTREMEAALRAARSKKQ